MNASCKPMSAMAISFFFEPSSSSSSSAAQALQAQQQKQLSIISKWSLESVFAQSSRSLKDPPRTWSKFNLFKKSTRSLKDPDPRTWWTFIFYLTGWPRWPKVKQKVFSGVTLLSTIPVAVFKKTEDIVEIVIVVIIIKVWHNAMVVKNSFPQKKTRTNNKLFYVNVFVNETIFLKF